jgi:DNA-binding SARP family transcriptional activator/outer membrane protein assembly factor BamB
MDKPCRIELFGSLRVLHQGRQAVDVPPQQTGVLLARLALPLGSRHTRDSLAALLWPESDTEKARQNLRQCLHSLRNILQHNGCENAILLANRSTVQLGAALVETDVDEFSQCLRAARGLADPSERIVALSRAADLYKSGLLPGHFCESFSLERAEMEEAYRGVLNALAQDLAANGFFEQAINRAHQLVALDTLNEDAHCQLMRLYARTGQPSSVQRQYRELEGVLRAELDETPLESSTQLAEELLHEARHNGGSESAIKVRIPSHPGGSSTPNGSVVIGCASVDADPRPARPTPSPVRVLARAAWLAAAFVVLVVGCAYAVFWLPNVRNARPRPAVAPQSGLTHRPPMTSTEHARAKPVGDRTPAKPSSRAGADQGSRIRLAATVAVAPVSAPNPDVFVSAPRGGPGSTVQTPSAHSSADTLWTASFKAEAGDKDSQATAIAVDASGQIYVTGFVETRTARDTDYLTIKYRPDGRILWVRRYNGPGSDLDRAYSIAVDGEGNTLVTGESDSGRDGSGPERLNGVDIVTVKYNPRGDVLWVSRYAGTMNGRDIGRKVEVDRSGSVYVFGQSWGGAPEAGGTIRDAVLIKYDRRGREQWLRRCNGPITFGDPILEPNRRMVGDPQGNVYITLGSHDVAGAPTMVTRKYDSSGGMLWESRYAGALKGPNVPSIVAVDPAGSVYVTGYSLIERGRTSATDIYTFVTIKHDSGGRVLWTRLCDGPGTSCTPNALSVSKDGDVCVAGLRVFPKGDCRYLTVKYKPDGSQEWVRDFAVGGANSGATGAAFNSDGDVYVTGRAGDEWATLKYFRFDGRPRRILRHAGPGGSVVPDNTAFCLVIDAEDRPIVAGQSHDGRAKHLQVIKYR